MTSPDLAALVTGFFVRYLAAERNVSPHTTAAYREIRSSCCSGFCATSRTDRSKRSGSKT